MIESAFSAIFSVLILLRLVMDLFAKYKNSVGENYFLLTRKYYNI